MSYTLRSITDLTGCLHFQALERIVWGSDETEVVPNHVLVTVVQNGGGLIGAYAENGPSETNGLVGAVFWWLGTTEDGKQDARLSSRRADHDARLSSRRAKIKVCSHIAGVHSDWQRRGIGAALKWAQRDVVLAQGLTEHVTWTYDPLLAANGVFNLHKLGASCRTYKRNVYGELQDDLNRGTPSDRCQVDWWVNSERVEGAKKGDKGQVVGSRGMVLSTRRRDDGLLEPVEQALAFDDISLAVPIPEDIGALRRADPELALAWRYHLRAVLEAAFEAGYVMVDCARVGSEVCYLLEREGTL